MSKVSMAGGLIAAFLASLCCIGPLLFGALGVGVGVTGFLADTAGFLKVLLPYRLVFIGLAGFLLGLSFYLAYRTPGGTCPSGVTCDSALSKPANPVLLWIITTFATALVLSPYWLALFTE